jgi:predicted phage tail component-like protein
MKREHFIFNDIHSKDLNIVVLEGPPSEINTEEYEEVKIEGRNGALIINNDTYPNLIKRFKVSILVEDSEEIYNIQECITDWLFNINNNKLIYDNKDKYYLVKKVITGDIFTNFDNLGDFTIEFICEPFKYLLGEYHIELENNSNIYYTGTVSGEPNIKIYGTGNIQLTINNETVQINNVNEYVELDSKLLLCLNKNKTSKTRDMIGHFPLLTRGSNAISWTGNVYKVEILPRTAYR